MVSAARYPKVMTLAIGFAFIYFVALLFHLPSLFFMAAALLCAPLVSYLLARAGLQHVEAERRLPERLWPDQQVTVEIRIRNHAVLPKCLLRIDEVPPVGFEPSRNEPPVCVVPMLWSEPYYHRYPITARKRGLYELPSVMVTAVDPLDLFRTRRSVGPSNEVLVYPRVVPLGLLSLHDSRTEGRVEQRPQMIGGSEFRGTREYHPGDDLRRVHWRSTARRGEMIVVEYEEPATADLFVILDVSAGSEVGSGMVTTLETGVTMAASVVAHELDHGNAVGLHLDGDPPRSFALTRDRPELLSFLEALALVRADRERSFESVVASVVPQLPSGVEVMLISTSRDRRVATALADLVRHSHAVAYCYLDPRGYNGGDEVEDESFLAALAGLGVRVFRIRDGDIVRGLSEPVR